ncbi:MAG: carboxymuconolactone decarboxylase family protein [Nakamurella sp.]
MTALAAAEQRMSIHDVDPAAYTAVLGLEKYVHAGGVDEALLAIVKSRASQINHCAWCLDMHLAEARKLGVAQRKLDVLAAWREVSTMFSDAERAALALTEQVTLISQDGVSDEVWSAVRDSFSDKQTVVLIMAITAINVWNRMNVTVRTQLPTDPGGN